MSEDDKKQEVTIVQLKHELIQSRLENKDDEGEGGSHWSDGSTRIQFEDPFKNYELLTDLAKHHQTYADTVQYAVEPDPAEKRSDLSNNFGMSYQNDFLPHPLLAGKPYFNGIDPKTTPLPSETMLTDSPEYNDVKNELKKQKELKKERQLQNDNAFNPKPSGP